MKYNLYIPSPVIKDKWEKYAKKDQRSLAAFIRVAVEEKIQRMLVEDRDKEVMESLRRA